MASDLLQQGIVAATGVTLTSANYVEETILPIIPPDSLLDYQVLVTAAGGLSARDLVFIVTAIITIRAALKVKNISLGRLGKLTRRTSDKSKTED